MRNKTIHDVEILSKETAYQGYFRIDKFHLKHQLFQGGLSPVVSCELFERGQVAAVLPYDPVRQQVVLIEQFRVGALNDEKSPWLLEIIAGVLEPHETNEALVHREAKEEAGITVADLVPIAHYWVSPGGCTERVALFCGRVDARGASGIHGLQDESENTLVHVVDIHEAFGMVRSGMINNAVSIIGVQWLELNYQKIWK